MSSLSSFGRRPRRAISRRHRSPPARKYWRRPELERLEDRTVPSTFLSLSGAQTLVAGSNVNTSNNAFTGESEMQITINAANPLQVAAFTHNVNNLNQMSVYHSSDGGVTWARTIISSANDGLGNGVRYDPTIRFDAFGRLFIAYGVNSGGGVTLVVARSNDGGTSFTQFRNVDFRSNIGNLVGLDKWFMATGSDGLGGQAVYVAYTRNISEVFGTDQQISVIGSNDGGNTFTGPLNIDDDSQALFGLGTDSSLFAGPAVGPNGELYVVWHDLNNGQIKLDRDLDGMFKGGFGFGSDVVIRNLNQSFLNKITPASPNRGFANGPSIDVDRVNFFGRVYVSFTDTFSGNDTDVFLVSSSDNGATWTSQGTIGNVEASTGTDFMASVAVDQTSGSVNVGYYTTAGDQATGNDDVNFRLASSIDGGATFSKVNLSNSTTRASAMGNGNEFGDYVGLAAFGGTVRGLWTDNRGLTADTEAFTATASFSSATSSNRLFVTGTFFSDTLEVRRSPVNGSYVEVFVNGQEQYAGLFASLNGIQVSALDGSDEILIDSTANGVPVSVFGGFGFDVIDLSFFSGNMDNLQGAITVDGGPDSDTVNLWDNATAFGDTYTVTNSSVSRIVFAGLTYNSTVEQLTLNAEGGNNTINVQSISAATTINAGGGNDTVNLGTGNLDTFGSAGVTVNGQAGTDRVVVADQTAGFGDTYTVTDTTLSRVFFTLTYGTIEGLTLNAETGSNTVNVNSTASGTPVTLNTGLGNDTVNVGSGNLDFLRGAVIVNGGAGTDAVNVNDQSPAFSDSYTITATTLTRFIFGGLTYGTIESLTLNAEAGNNAINVRTTAAATPLTINAGAGDDTITLGSLAPVTVHSINSLVTVNGNAGNDTIIVDDSGSIVNENGTVTTTSIAGLGMAFGVSYGTVENVQIRTGLGNDTVSNFVPFFSGINVTINLDGGLDGVAFFGTAADEQIVVSRVVGPNGAQVIITVNGQVAFVNGYLNGETVVVHAGGGDDEVILDDSAAVTWNAKFFGEGGNDHLVGNSKADILVGGDGADLLEGLGGRDLLIGGAGLDTLFGGDEEDILIGGYTAYDADEASLDVIMTEWTRTDLDYDGRIKNLRKGVGPASAVVLDKTTVFDDHVLDALTGGQGLDWFVDGDKESILDGTKGELH